MTVSFEERKATGREKSNWKREKQLDV